MSVDSIWHALAGGALIGLASAAVLVGFGRIAGVSGTLGRALDPDDGRGFRLAFLAGLIGTGAIVAVVAPGAIGAAVTTRPVLAVAGFLVGLGTTLANGCTSGHGVCGISRGSRRSLVAVVAFMAAGMATVAVVGALR
jgi:uncharacterized membrane protein YedE/YeeE